MPSTLYVIGVILVIFILRIESTYNTFTYNDGVGDDEHCCLVRIDNKFCLAKPLTRSLVQVRKECQRLGANEKNKDYLNKIVRRLDVGTVEKIGDKILLELETPLENDILEKDLLCLSEANNNINLEKCYIQLTIKKNKKKQIGDGDSDNTTANEPVADEKADDDINEIIQVEVTSPIKVRPGHALTVHETHALDLTDCEVKTHQERQCWSWYRTHTKELCSNPKICQKNCIDLSHQHEKCLQELLKKKSGDNQQETFSIPIGSKLYCENNNNQQTQLLGYHRHTKLCFQTNHHISIEYKFTDYVSLSDRKKNDDVLQFIANNTKLTDEFESDCKDKTTLVDIRKALETEAAEAITTDDNPSTEE